MPEWLLDLFGRYGYAVVFFGVLLENAGLAGAGGNGAPVDRFFARYGARTVFIARFVTGLRVFGAVLAGASGLGWSKFLFYNATGAVVWATAIVAVGYSLAYSWHALERWIGRSGLIALVVVTVLVALALRRARRGAPS